MSNFFIRFLVLLVVSTSVVKAQQKKLYKISGHLTVQSTNATLADVKLNFSPSLSHVVTDDKGFFEIELNSGTYTLSVTHIGYDTLFLPKIQLHKNLQLNLVLKSRIYQGKEVNIRAKERNSNVSAVSGGVLKLDMRNLKELPTLLGDADPIRILQLMPGVGNGGEGNSGLYVRGGAAGQNLVLLNDAPVYNPSHMLGLFSLFNTDVINDVTLTKSGIPAEFSGRLSALLEANSAHTIADKTQVRGDVGLLSSRVTVETPLTSNWSVSLSARKTYLGLTVWPIIRSLKSAKETAKSISYDLYDVNFSSVAKLGNKDQLQFSWYQGRDNFGFEIPDFGISNDMNWGNKAGSLKWLHSFNQKLLLTNTVSYTDYGFDFGVDKDSYQTKITSAIRDIGYKSNLSYFTENHQLKAGLEYINHYFVPNTPYAKSADLVYDFGIPNKYYAVEKAAFISDKYTVTDKLLVYAGLRYTNYKHNGPFTEVKNDPLPDTLNYGRGKTVRSFHAIEPRFLLRYQINDSASVKFSYTRNYQFTHLVSVTSVNFPSDFWIPSLKNAPPEYGTQLSLGYFRNFKQDTYETSIDIYWKDMHNQLEFNNTIANMIDNLRIEDNVYSGRGISYGAEVFLKKNQGRLKGWLSYSLGKTYRIFKEISDGQPFPAKYDRRHNGALVLSYSLNSKWSMGAAFVYSSGSRYTEPLARYIINGAVVNEYGPYNGARMPDYHRLDLSANYLMKQTKTTKQTLSFSVYNVYNRQNAAYIFFLASGDLDKYKVSVKKKNISVLPIVPAVNWSFQF